MSSGINGKFSPSCIPRKDEMVKYIRVAFLPLLIIKNEISTLTRITSKKPMKSKTKSEIKKSFYDSHKILFVADFRCLNIPLAPLGFYSPLHFISCIPMAMCEPYRNDKLFLGKSRKLVEFHAPIPIYLHL